MTMLHIELSDDLVEEIERLAGQAGLDRDAFISQALRRQINLTRTSYRSRMGMREFEAVRERLRPYAERAGYTDEDASLGSTS